MLNCRVETLWWRSVFNLLESRCHRGLSLRCRYLTNPLLSVGNRYTGIYWAGNVNDAVQGLHYGLAVVSGTHEYGCYLGGSLPTYNPNQMGYYGDISYSNSCENLGFTVGINIGYQPAGLPALFTTDTDSAIMGYNPYVELAYQNFSLMTELAVARVCNGKMPNSFSVYNDAWPVGINFIPAYKFNDEWEVVFRYSYLDTNWSRH